MQAMKRFKLQICIPYIFLYFTGLYVLYVFCAYVLKIFFYFLTGRKNILIFFTDSRATENTRIFD